MVETPNDICPVCRHEDISYNSPIEPYRDVWKQKCSCPKCNSTWNNIYTLVEDGYENVKPGKTKNMKMLCPKCNIPIEYVEVHAAFDRKAKLLQPSESEQLWSIQITEEDERIDYEVEYIICPKCLEFIHFDNIHGETTARIKRD